MKLETLPDGSYVCPKCNGVETYTEQKGKHIGLYCKKCGYIKFLAQPWQKFKMPFGKYKGKTLLWMRKNDTPYMIWCRNNISANSIRHRCAEALETPSDDVEKISESD